MNETLDRLREEPGVIGVQSSMAGRCLVVDHEQVPVDELIELVRRHLHGFVVSSTERVMIAIDPRVAEVHCTHR